MFRVVIIGGGITGLATAHRLLELSKENSKEIEFLLLEAGSRLGGVVKTYHRDGFLLEAGPDAFISEKPEALNLANRIGLASQLIETNKINRKSFIAFKNRLHPVPEGFHLLAPSRLLPFITTDIFTWTGKARMAMDLILPKRQTNNDNEESLAQFVRRRLGEEALERMAQPMVGGIYTADPELLSLQATMPRFIEMERKHRSLILALWRARQKQDVETRQGTSGARYSLFLSFKDGMQALVDQLTSLLPNDSIKLNTEVSSLNYSSRNSKWEIKCKSNETIEADAICISLPAHRSTSLLKDLNPTLASELSLIPYASTATINLAYKRADIPHPLNGFGFVVPAIERRTILACTFSSIKFPGRAPDNCVLLRAFVGGAMQPENFILDEERMVQAVCTDLKLLLGIDRFPLFTHVEKWPQSMAQYHIGHLDRIRRIEKQLEKFPTLQLTGNAYNGAGIPDCIRSGETAERIYINLYI
jgi:protoporphyrinogen/coproporphyrinogen III oxidase